MTLMVGSLSFQTSMQVNDTNIQIHGCRQTYRMCGLKWFCGLVVKSPSKFKCLLLLTRLTFYPIPCMVCAAHALLIVVAFDPLPWCVIFFRKIIHPGPPVRKGHAPPGDFIRPDVLELRLRHVRFQSSLEIGHVDSLKDLDFNFIWWYTYPSEKYEFLSWGYYSQ